MLKLDGCSELHSRVAQKMVILFVIQQGMDITADDLAIQNNLPTLLSQNK